jgi:hypothetical protein
MTARRTLLTTAVTLSITKWCSDVRCSVAARSGVDRQGAVVVGLLWAGHRGQLSQRFFFLVVVEIAEDLTLFGEANC